MSKTKKITMFSNPQESEEYWQGFIDCTLLFKRIAEAVYIDNLEVARVVKEITSSVKKGN